MKKIITLLLLFSLLLSTVGCMNESNRQDDQPTPVENALVLINSICHPTDIYFAFTGDYSISGITSTPSINLISRKGNTQVTQYDSSHTDYQIRKEWYEFSVRSADNTSPTITSEQAVTQTNPQSIFWDFGMDNLFLVLWLNGDTFQIPNINSEMLTVNPDGVSCNISKEYARQFAAAFYQSQGWIDEVIEKTLETMDGGGSYTQETNTFSVWFKAETEYKKFHTTYSYTVTPDNKVHITYKDEYRMSEDAPLISISISFSDTEFDGNTPIFTRIKSEIQREFDNLIPKRTTLTQTELTLDRRNEKTPQASGIEKTWNSFEVEQLGFLPTGKGSRMTLEDLTNKKAVATIETMISFDLSKETNQFTYSRKENSKLTSSISANRIRFGTPSVFPEIPDSIIKLVDTRFSELTKQP